MRKKYAQMSLFDTYGKVEEHLEKDKPELFRLLDEHLDWEQIIPGAFYTAFYQRLGRNRKYGLESFMKALVLQRIFHYVEDSQLLNTLRFSYEMRDYCGFHKVPDAAKLTRFKQDFCSHLRGVFERLLDFRKEHPSFIYGTFTADSAFDSYDNYAFLMNDFHFKRVVIPMNTRNSHACGTIGFNKNGTPLCPKNGSSFLFVGKTGGKNRSSRLKFVCPASHQIGNTRVCTCDTPCTDSSYGKCIYVYPNKNLRLYPGIPRNSEEFSTIYNHRASVERSIYSLKDTLGIANRKTSNTLTTKADLFLAGIVQLLCVLLAEKLHDAKLARRPRRLIA